MKEKALAPSSVYAYNSQCRCDIKRHHNDMKDDPERLTTEFLIDITGCPCSREGGKQIRKREMIKLTNHHTSAKGNWKSPRVNLICSVCGKHFTMMPSEYRKYERKGKGNIRCSRACYMKERYGGAK